MAAQEFEVASSFCVLVIVASMYIEEFVMSLLVLMGFYARSSSHSILVLCRALLSSWLEVDIRDAKVSTEVARKQLVYHHRCTLGHDCCLGATVAEQ